MNYHIIAYSIYLPATIGLSIWIAQSLHRNTRAFLLNKFSDRGELADSTNNLIKTGFYLLALGFSFMFMRIRPTLQYIKGSIIEQPLQNGQQTIEQLSTKMGTFVFVLGILLFLNFFVMIAIQAPKKVREIKDNKLNID